MPQNVQDYALIIGINRYSSLKRLNGPLGDASRFKDWLEKESGGNLPSKNVHTVLYDVDPPERPFQNDIDNIMANIFLSANASGYRRLYFFFAGHGIGAKWNETGLCLPVWSELFRNAALSSSKYLGTIVESGSFKEVFFFLDCCRNRKINSTPLPPLFGWPKPGVGTADCQSFVAYAAPFDNPAFETENWVEDDLRVQGLFTKALIMGLETGARNQEGLVTTNSLKSFLKPKVEELAKNSKLVQSVRYEDAFSSVGTIVDTPLLVDVSVTITFGEAGTVSLKGPDLNIIKKGSVKKGDSWKLPLPKGRYLLTNFTSQEEANFFIDGTLNPFTYAFKI